MPFFGVFCSFLFFNPFQARSASGIAFFFQAGENGCSVLHSLVLSPGNAGGRSRRIFCYLSQARRVAKPLLLLSFMALRIFCPLRRAGGNSAAFLHGFCLGMHWSEVLFAGKHRLLRFGRGIALVVPLLALATSRLLSLINNCKIWQHGLLFFWKQKWSHGDSETYQAVAKRTGLSNGPVPINSVGSHRMHGPVRKYARICLKSSK